MNALAIKTFSPVNNDNIMKAGDSRFHFENAAGKSIRVQINGDGVHGIRIIGEGHFTDSTGTQNLGKFVLYASGVTLTTYYFSAGSYDLVFEDSYNIQFIDLATSTATLKLIEWPIKYMVKTNQIRFTNLNHDGTLYLTEDDISAWADRVTNLWCGYGANKVLLDVDIEVFSGSMQVFEAGSCKIHGNLSAVENWSSGLASFMVPIAGTEKLHGNLTSIYGKKSLGTLYLANHDISGNLNDLLDNLYSSGKTSGNLSVRLSGTGCVYNGAPITTTTLIFSFSSSGWQQS